MRSLSPSEKLEAVREVLNKNKTLNEVSLKFQVSRQTLASWTHKFDPKKGKISLKNAYRRGKNHPKKLPFKIEKVILDLVIKNPVDSLYILRKKLEDRGLKVSLTGVYNVLLRYQLQTKELRRRFSLEHPIKTVF